MNYTFGKVEAYLLKDTDLTKKEILRQLSKDNIVGAKIKITVSNGKEYIFDVPEILKLTWEMINGKKIITDLGGDQ